MLTILAEYYILISHKNKIYTYHKVPKSSRRRMKPKTSANYRPFFLILSLKYVLQIGIEMKRVCVFQGSFDPFHLGHFEIVQVLLEQKLVDHVILAPNNPNSKKWWRSPLDFRVDLMRKMIMNDKISIHCSPVDSFVDSKMMGVMGSDQYLTLKKKGKPPHLDLVHWFIVPRQGYPMENHKSLKFQLLPESWFKNQHLSSTMIKQSWQQVENQFGFSADAWNLIRNEYGRHKIFKTPYLIIKKFACKESFQQEVESYKIMQELFPSINIPILYKTNAQDLTMTMSNEGESIDQLEIKDTEKWQKIGQEIGQILSRLHSFSKIKDLKIEDSGIQKHSKFQKLSKFFAKHDQISIYQDFIENPGSFGYVHGDASIGNFLVSNSGRVTMIDFAGIFKYGPYGIPAYEYFQFLSSINWKIKDNGEQKNGQELAQGFKKGYKNDTLFTRQALRACKTYWNVDDS